MRIKIAWLYYDLLELYGDRGNIKVLEYLLKKNNIEFEIDKISLNDQTDISDHDILFLGGGSDYAQNMMYKDLISRKEQIITAMDRGAFVLTICGGYQLFGQYYIDSTGKNVDGLQIFDFYSVGGTNRCIGNVVATTTLNGEEIELVGFENHGGQTLNVSTPFAKVKYGNGNSFDCGAEGFMTHNFIGTYLHGPLLPKNPKIAKYIIETVAKNKYNEVINIELQHTQLVENAKKDLKQKLNIN